MPVWSWLCRCGFVTFRQPVAVAFLFQRQVGLYPLLCMPLLITQAVFFQHHGQPQPEHFQAEHIPVPVSLHIGQIRVIKIFTVITRDDAGITHKHPVSLQQHFQITAKSNVGSASRLILSASSEFFCDWSSARAVIGSLNFCISWCAITARSRAILSLSCGSRSS